MSSERGAQKRSTSAGVEGARVALATDLYELTMGASYLALGMDAIATFSLFARNLPPRRPFLVVAGIEEALRRLGALEFDEGAIEYLQSIGYVRRDVLGALARTRFQGDVRAVGEGRVVFAGEPILEVRAPIVQAQLVETILLNTVHFPTLVATKAARCVSAVPGKPLIDFSFRRTPSIEAGVAAARACYLAGFSATSNVLAGRELGIPVAGTLAHSFIELFPSEVDAFYAFAGTFPGPVILLVDTYDTLSGVAHAIEIARALEGSGRKIAAVRLDSGDLASLAEEARRALDEAGLRDVRIMASGGLDELSLRALRRASAPIDMFGMGTKVGVSADAPALDLAYKLVDYGGQPCLKLSQGKETLVGPKQVFRCRGEDGRFAGDVIAAWDEPCPGPPGNAASDAPGGGRGGLARGVAAAARGGHARRSARAHAGAGRAARAPPGGDRGAAARAAGSRSAVAVPGDGLGDPRGAAARGGAGGAAPGRARVISASGSAPKLRGSGIRGQRAAFEVSASRVRGRGRAGKPP